MVWVPGVGIVRRDGDPQDKRDLVTRYAQPDTGAGVYVSVAAENAWHARAQKRRDPETGN